MDKPQAYPIEYSMNIVFDDDIKSLSPFLLALRCAADTSVAFCPNSTQLTAF